MPQGCSNRGCDSNLTVGGMFEFVSGANYLGEIVEWTGFAIACWSFEVRGVETECANTERQKQVADSV